VCLDVSFSYAICIAHCNTRNEKQLHLPSVKLTSVKKGITRIAIKIFNHLPSNILELQENKAPFMLAFRKCLLTHVFYPVEEFLVHNIDTNK
jgi:hypothetical protein